MKISIVMATYNGEKFILKQLESILRQSLPADEVIIGDDSSSDRTVEIIEDFIRENNLDNWILKINEENLGWRRNFFTLLGHVTGDIIFFSDQDDIWIDDKLQVMSEIIKNNDNILALAGCVCLIDVEDKKFSTQKKYSFFSSNSNEVSFQKFHVKVGYTSTAGCALAISKKLLKYIKYVNYKSMSYIPHDMFFWWLATFFDGAYKLDREVIRYRIHDKNVFGINNSTISGTEDICKRIRWAEEHFNINKDLIHIIKQKGTSNKTYKMEILKKTLKIIKMRMALLKNRKIIYIPALLCNVKYYPKASVFMGDIAYAFKINIFVGRMAYLIRALNNLYHNFLN